MKTKLIKASPQANQLIIYFAGWATPPSAVSHLRLPANRDLLLCYDYQHLQLNVDVSPYQHIDVVAWSMGVWVATQVLNGIALRSATAINGTPLPCHDQFGIPENIFKGTLDNLSEINKSKFERRMCGDKQSLAHYQQLADHRSFAETQAELTALYQMIRENKPQSLLWTKVIIGKQDHIFPVANQQAYWQDKCTIQYIDAGHYLLHQLTHWAEIWD